MDRNWGHVLGKIGQGRLENRFRVIVDTPRRALAALLYQTGNRTGVVAYRALKCSADNAMAIDRKLKEHHRVASFLLCERENAQRHPFAWLTWI